jgi:hypothetical protein
VVHFPTNYRMKADGRTAALSFRNLSERYMALKTNTYGAMNCRLSQPLSQPG